MKMWLTIVLIISNAVCAAGWIMRYISCAMLLWYLGEKGISPPSEAEMAEGSKWVAQHIIEDLLSWKNKR